MNFELIAGIILFLSFLGMAIIIFRKIPLLLTLPEISQEKKESLILRLGNKIKGIIPFKNFSYELVLQKILSKIRILTLKTDIKTFDWLKRLRMKAKIRKNLDANYWEEIKKNKEEK